MLPILEVTKLTLLTIRDRGWTYTYSNSENGPLNIRSAVSHACTQLCPKRDWHDTYRMVIAAIGNETKNGISCWEAGPSSARKIPKRTQIEVEQMLELTIIRLEKHEAQARTGVRANRTDRRIV